MHHDREFACGACCMPRRHDMAQPSLCYLPHRVPCRYDGAKRAKLRRCAHPRAHVTLTSELVFLVAGACIYSEGYIDWLLGRCVVCAVSSDIAVIGHEGTIAATKSNATRYEMQLRHQTLGSLRHPT